MSSEQETPVVSVVIPAYNAEKTLRRTLECVLNQTWQALQVVLVDDGSKDGTVDIAREKAREDSRLTVIDQPNRGISAARNTGLEHCSGKYIRFVDADDTLPADSVEKMVRRAEQDGAELVIGGYNQYFGEIGSYHNLAGRNDVADCDDLLDHLCSHANSYFYGVLWNKLFIRELAEKGECRFRRDLTWGEDFAFVMDYFCGVRTVSFINESLYDYRRTPGSTTFRQVLDCVRHPLKNAKIKEELYGHLKDMYRNRGQYEKYRKRLWMYLFRVGLN